MKQTSSLSSKFDDISRKFQRTYGIEIWLVSSISPRVGKLTNTCNFNITTTLILTEEFLSKYRSSFLVISIFYLLWGDKEFWSLYLILIFWKLSSTGERSFYKWDMNFEHKIKFPLVSLCSTDLSRLIIHIELLSILYLFFIKSCVLGIQREWGGIVKHAT